MSRLILGFMVALCFLSTPAKAEGQVKVMGDTLYLSGQIGQDMIDSWNAQHMAGVRNIAITSHGGSVAHALAVAHLVKRKGFHIMVTDYCESACTLILSAGKERIGFRGSFFLIHGASADLKAYSKSAEPSSSEAVSASNKAMREFYIENGIDPSFVELTVQSGKPLRDITLTADEAKKIGLITRIY